MSNISESQVNQQISQLIKSSRFNEAFSMLKNRMKAFDSLNLELNKLEKSESTYRYLLDFIVSGNSDPSRKEVMDQIRDSLLRANDLLLREYKLKDSSDIYSSTRRIEALKNIPLEIRIQDFKNSYLEDNPDGGYRISQNQSQKLNEVFNYLWTLTPISTEDSEIISEALNDPSLPEYFKLSVISAMILGSLTYFDAEVFEILLNQYENSESLSVKARAITGILLISLVNSQRLKGNLNLRSRLLLSIDDEDLQKIIRDVLISVIRTYDTKRIDSKMRNEVLPGLMKIKPEIIERMRNLANDSEDFLSDSNPNWEELIENSDIGDKLREINELQLEGADVMVTAFSHLKTFPFFNNVSSWFIPFVPQHYEFENLSLPVDSESIDRLTFVMCDSDLHSFLLSFKQLPEANRNQMLKNMEAQMKEAQEAMGNAIGETEGDKLYRKIRQSLQDIYRFFKFYRKKEDFIDPFGQPFLSQHLQPLISLLGISTEDLRLIGEFYFQKKYFDEASDILELYDSLESADMDIWEKIGFSHDRSRRYNKALEWYKKAELVNPDNTWLIKKIALALKNSGHYYEAVEYYEKALAADPENYHLLMSAAQSMIESSLYQKALQHLYHAQYLKPEKLDVKRAIAWTELLLGNADKAISIYSTIINGENTNPMDYLNAAHSYLASGDFKNAVSLYKTFIDKSESKDIKALVLAFKDDTPTLKKLNIKTEDLRLIVDKIRYDR